MEGSLKRKQRLRVSRAQRVRKQLRGTSSRPRLSIHLSNKHLSAQLIDDGKGHTLGAVSTLSEKDGALNKDTAKRLGEQMAEIAKKHDITKAVFDRGCRKYHGKLAAFAEGAREAGLNI